MVLAGLWLIGLFIKSSATHQLEDLVESTIARIPIIKSIYQPVAQVIELIRRGGEAKMQGMAVVYCTFGVASGTGLLALRASEHVYRFGEQDCYVVYVPTSPVPMSGGILFAPVETVQPVEMDVEDLMKLYLSLGIVAPHVVPTRYTPSTPPVT